MRRATIVILSLVLLAAPAAVAACGGDVTASGGATGDEAAESTDDLKNVVDRAVETGNLETLTTALTEAGLVETLKGAGPFTVFAPTDEAFDALPDGALDELLADPQGELTKVLTYHVVPGEIMSAELTDGMTVETLQGGGADRLGRRRRQRQDRRRRPRDRRRFRRERCHPRDRRRAAAAGAEVGEDDLRTATRGA